MSWWDATLGAGLSLGNAMLHHPGAVFQMLMGLGLVDLGASGDCVSFVVDLTGVGALAGVPLGVASTAVAAGGAALGARGLATIAAGATGPQRVTIVNAENASGTGGSPNSASARNLSDLPRGARTTRDEQYIFQRLKNNNGIDPNTASDRLHAIKRENGLSGDDNVTFDMSGNVYRPNGDYIGSLTQGEK